MVLGSGKKTTRQTEELGFPESVTAAYVKGIALVNGNGEHIIPSLITPATDLEGIGDISVGTSEIVITIIGTPTQSIRIQADTDNTGIIFIGKTGVLSNKTNDFVRLFAGDDLEISYDDATSALYAISDTAAQTINVGALF